MCDLLMGAMGFQRNEIEVLRDEPGQSPPTRHNILQACRRLVAGAREGDLLFFHFSGHGAQVDDASGAEEDGLNEVILPCDWRKAGMITDDELNEAMVEPLPSGCRLVAVMDCCHAGTGLDLAFTCEDGRSLREDTNPLHVRGDVVLFSGCEDWDTSAEQRPWFSQASGIMTEAFVACVRSGPHTYASLLKAIGSHIYWKGHSQRPQLSSSQRFDLTRPFSLTPGPGVPNSHERLGRLMRKRFHPARRMYGPLREELLEAGFAFAAGWLVADAVTSVAAASYEAAPASYAGLENSPDEEYFSASDAAECATS